MTKLDLVNKTKLLGERLINICRSHLVLLSCLAIFGLVILFVPTMLVKVATSGERYAANDIAKVPTRKVAIVFGAGVLPDGTPTEYLKHRIETAVDLYNAEKVEKILMTGDNGQEHYNEPDNMKKYAQGLGVSGGDIVVDYAGFNTYDSCYRAKAIFKLDEAIVITQGYHLPRAVHTCSGLGVKSVGVAAKRTGRDFTVSYILREYISTNKALMQLLFRPKPKLLGDPIQI